MLGIPMHRVHWLLEGRTYKQEQRVRGENFIVNWTGARSRTIDNRVVREIENLGKCRIKSVNI